MSLKCEKWYRIFVSAYECTEQPELCSHVDMSLAVRGLPRNSPPRLQKAKGRARGGGGGCSGLRAQTT